jgi:hypothetical protein
MDFFATNCEGAGVSTVFGNGVGNDVGLGVGFVGAAVGSAVGSVAKKGVGATVGLAASTTPTINSNNKASMMEVPSSRELKIP